MDIWIDESNCTGCLSCVAFCPKCAIVKGHTDEGFYYPQIQSNLCDDCEQCVTFCNGITSQERHTPFSVYSFQSNNRELLLEATSGGAFEMLSRMILSDNGVVFGAVYDEQMNVRHQSGYTFQDIRKMNGSKYVQSDPSESYRDAIIALENGRKVLFSGTPCQIAGLLRLTGNCENLYTVDLLCYGIPSPTFFAGQIADLEKKYNARMIDFRFRDKHKNGFSHTTVLKFIKDGNVFEVTIDKYMHVPYHYAFAKRNCFQRKCYNCDYNTPERVSDITLASFWNIDRFTKMYKVKDGVSMILVNTEKGKEFVGKILPDAIFREHSLDEAIEVNHALKEGVSYPKDRDRIMSVLTMKGFSAAKSFYRPPSLLKRMIVNKLSRRIIGLLRKQFER